MTDPQPPSQTLREALTQIQQQCAGHADEFSQRVWHIAEAALAAQEAAPQPEIASTKLLVDSALVVGRRDADQWKSAWASLVAGILGHFPPERHGEDVVALLLEMRQTAEAQPAIAREAAENTHVQPEIARSNEEASDAEDRRTRQLWAESYAKSDAEKIAREWFEKGFHCGYARADWLAYDGATHGVSEPPELPAAYHLAARLAARRQEGA